MKTLTVLFVLFFASISANAQILNTPDEVINSPSVGIVQRTYVVTVSEDLTAQERSDLLAEIASGLRVQFVDGVLVVPPCITFPDGAELIVR